MIFPNLQVALPLVRAGEVRALAITSLQRFSATPELPTMVEQGFPGFEATAWFGSLPTSKVSGWGAAVGLYAIAGSRAKAEASDGAEAHPQTPDLRLLTSATL